MEGHAYIGELLGGIVYLIAGVRLLHLGQRTREAPERLLGASFCFMGTSSLLYVLPVFPAFEPLWTPLNFAGRVAYLPAAAMLALFMQRVFRPGEQWATWLAWGITVLLATGVGGSALGGDWEGFSISNGWFWLEWLGYTLPFVWVGAETFVQYSQARRRVRLELCDPLVCNRYLLWALFGAFQTFGSLVILPQYAQYERENLFTATWDILYGVGVNGSLFMIWLVFFPPAVYRHWIRGAAPVATVAEN